LYDFVPKKLEFPYKQRFEGAPDQKQKVNKHQEAMDNNIALQNICRNDKNFD
jgi:hypothetical protein